MQCECSRRPGSVPRSRRLGSTQFAPVMCSANRFVGFDSPGILQCFSQPVAFGDGLLVGGGRPIFEVLRKVSACVDDRHLKILAEFDLGEPNCEVLRKVSTCDDDRHFSNYLIPLVQRHSLVLSSTQEYLLVPGMTPGWQDSWLGMTPGLARLLAWHDSWMPNS